MTNKNSEVKFIRSEAFSSNLIAKSLFRVFIDVFIASTKLSLMFIKFFKVAKSSDMKEYFPCFEDFKLFFLIPFNLINNLN